MRRVIVEVEASLNGAMGSESMDFWRKLFEFQSQDVLEYLNDLIFTPDALLMGKKTYQGFADIWPKGKARTLTGSTACPSTSHHEP